MEQSPVEKPGDIDIFASTSVTNADLVNLPDDLALASTSSWPSFRRASDLSLQHRLDTFLPRRTMKIAFVLLTALSVFSQATAFAFTNVGRPAATYAYRASELRMAAEEREVKDVKVGVIGCGRIGLVHLEAITKAPGVTPVIVSNPTVSKAEKGTTTNELVPIDF